MQEKFKNWSMRIWGGVAALAILAGLLAAVVDIKDYFDKQRPTETPLPSATLPPPTNTRVVTETVTSTPGPLQFLQLPTQAKVGEDVFVSLQASSGEICYLEYYTPDGNLSTAKGLGQTMADYQGKCIWEWHLSANTRPGIGKLIVSWGGLKETHELQIVE